jgi:hypothetical protein
MARPAIPSAIDTETNILLEGPGTPLGASLWVDSVSRM